MFTIDCLEILPGCDESLCKNLKPETKYYFNDRHEGNKSLINRVPNFWGDHINVQAIVGKNGSGKSTLMDLMYMAINNFSYMFERGNKRKRPGAIEMYFVSGLRVNLYFSTDNGEYILECGDKSVWLKKNDGTELTPNLTLDEIDSPDEDKYKKRYSEDSEIANLVVDFFYTIVSNYSMQSFIDENYKRDVYEYLDEEDPSHIERGRDYANHDKESISPESWITPIFHKNDGYVRSIVLNPYRYNGTINLKNEYELSKDRVCSLFIYSKIVGNNFWERYESVKINIEFWQYDTNDHLSDSIKKELSKWVLPSEREEFSSLFSSFCFIAGVQNKPFSEKIIQKFGIKNNGELKNPFSPPQDEVICKETPVAYLQYKILKIISTYHEFNEYKDVFCVKLNCKQNSADDAYKTSGEVWIEIVEGKEARCDELLTKIINDNSHITKKIRRTINFLKLNSNIISRLYQDEEKNELYKGTLDLRDFATQFANKSVFFNNDGELDSKIFDEDGKIDLDKIKKWISPQIIDDCLPPPFFDWKLIFNKYDENGDIIKVKKDTNNNVYEKLENGTYTKNGQPIDAEEVPNLEIPYNQLSSGEIQFLQTISIHTYHIMNLISVPNDGNHPKYKNFNLVFDEVEICFHPEMQRQFLNKLITVLKDMKANEGNSINIFIITHSPFILSDIPASNVLFLKDGVPNNETKKRITFAENIGEMMYDSFFMEKTIGDFAEQKLKELIKKRQGKKTTMSDEEAKFILDNIGDPVIRSLIEEVEPLQND